MVSICMIFLGTFISLKFSLLSFWGIFNKTIIPLALVGYEMIIANLPICNSMAIYHASHMQRMLVEFLLIMYLKVF